MRFSNRTRWTGAIAAAFLLVSAMPALAVEPSEVMGATPEARSGLVDAFGSDMTLELWVIGEPESKVSVSPDKYVDVDASEFALDLSALAGDYATRGTEVCYGATMVKKYYNAYGNVSSQSEMYFEWCGQNGVVSRVLTQVCSGYGGSGWEYRGCSKWHSSTGFSKVTVGGSWTYRFGFQVYVYRYVSLSSKHYPTGAYSGTWTMNQ